MSTSLSKKRYLNYLYEKTFLALEQGEEKDFQTDAITMSVDLQINRANVSRMLNELWRENLLVKIEGRRPIFYLHRECIKSKFDKIYIPSIISKGDSIWNYLLAKEKKIESSFDQIFGIGPNESLHSIFEELSMLLNYSFTSKKIMFFGERHTGKKFLIDTIMQHFKTQNKQSSKSFEINWQRTKYDNAYLVAVLKEIEKEFFDYENMILFIKDFDKVDLSLCQLLFSRIEDYEEIAMRENSKLLIFFHCESDLTRELSFSKSINHLYFVKSFNNRTIKERSQFILNFFQNESNKVKLSIECPVPVINCLIASKYENNFFDLKNEIEMTLAKVKFKAKKNESKLLAISFDELSDKVLNEVSNISEILPEIRKINHLWKSDSLYFIPQANSEALDILKGQNVDRKGNLSIFPKKKCTIDKYIRQFLSSIEVQVEEFINLKVNDKILSPLRELLKKYGFTDKVIKSIAIELENLSDADDENGKELPFFAEDGESAPIDPQIKKDVSEFFGFLNDNSKRIFSSELKIFLEKLIQYYRKDFSTDGKISILVMCHGKDIAEKYVSSVRSRGYDGICDYLNYTFEYQKENFNDFLNVVIEKITDIDQGKGVVLLTDIEPLSTIAQILSHSIQVKLGNISPISLPLLNQVCQVCSDPKTTFEDIETLIDSESFGKSGRVKLVNEISSKHSNSTYQILSESLTFLDPEKVVMVCNDVFSRILPTYLEKSNITYKESLKLRFIFHCSFMIERAIRREPLRMKNVSVIIEKNLELYQSIEKNIQFINEVFGVQIVIDEIARLLEIFNMNSELFN